MRFAEPMSTVIHVRVSAEEKREMFEAARRRGMSLSEYLREREGRPSHFRAG